MGLDVYVGSVTRYLCGDWETVGQRYARENGLPLQVVRPNESPEAITNPAEVLPAVLQWRDSLSLGLQNAGGPALDWDERAAAPYFTDKPSWDTYGDLVLWAAYTEKGLTPPSASVAEWQNDAVFRGVAAGATRYPTLLGSVEVWFPVEFDFTFQAEWITGNVVQCGSAQQLIRELDDLNRSLGSPANRNQWRQEGKAPGEPLEKGARFALAVLSAVAADAVTHRLIMKLDY